MRPRWILWVVLALIVSVTTSFASPAAAATAKIRFTNTALLQPEGASEPAVTIGADGVIAISAVSWGWRTSSFQVFPGHHIWKGPFGTTPIYQGLIDPPTERLEPAFDADIDLGSTGTLHAASARFSFAEFNKWSVIVFACPNADTSDGFAHCSSVLIDANNVDRPWITSDGPHVYLSYNDAGSRMFRVWRSDDDGFTWSRVGSVLPGHGTDTATKLNMLGPVLADSGTHNVYVIYAAGSQGEPSTAENIFDLSNIFVSRSADMGASWTPSLVVSVPPGTSLGNLFPALAIDPSTGLLYAAWSDAHNVFFSMSSDEGTSWSSAVAVNIAPAATAIFPWLAARDGTVDLVYYATSASNKDDPSAVWNVYLAQTTDSGTHWTQVRVSDHPNHLGAACYGLCGFGTLLDLFEIAINPVDGKAAIIYVDDTLATWTDSLGAEHPLPQVVVAQQK